MKKTYEVLTKYFKDDKWHISLVTDNAKEAFLQKQAALNDNCQAKIKTTHQ